MHITVLNDGLVAALVLLLLEVVLELHLNCLDADPSQTLCPQIPTVSTSRRPLVMKAAREAHLEFGRVATVGPGCGGHACHALQLYVDIACSPWLPARLLQCCHLQGAPTP